MTFLKINKFVFVLILFISSMTVSAQGIGFDDNVNDETEEVNINKFIVFIALSGLIYGYSILMKKKQIKNSL